MTLVSHGGHDPGATFHDLKEKDLVLEICQTALSKLQWQYWTALTRIDDAYISIHDRGGMAITWHADLFISIHANADPDPDLPDMSEIKGEEIWIYPDYPQARLLAEAMKEHVDQFFPSHGFRGIKESAHFGVLNRTANANIPAVLVEIGFVDHLQTYGAFQDDLIRKHIGHLISAGVKNYLKGIK